MPLLPLEELRALVGEAGAHLTDEELLRMDVDAEWLSEFSCESYRDQRDPVAAARRRELDRLQLAREKAPRRRQYERTRARGMAAAPAREEMAK